LPLFVVHDLGALLTAPRGPAGVTLGARADAPRPRAAMRGEREDAGGKGDLAARYLDLLRSIASSDVIEKAAGWRLRDDLVGVLILRVLGDIWSSWSWRGKSTGAMPLPLDPDLYTGVDVAGHFRDFDPRPLFDFLEHLVRHKWHVVTCVEQIDLDTLRLLGVFHYGRDEGGGGALELPDLFQAMRSPEASDVTLVCWGGTKGPAIEACKVGGGFVPLWRGTYACDTKWTFLWHPSGAIAGHLDRENWYWVGQMRQGRLWEYLGEPEPNLPLLPVKARDADA